MTRAVHNERPQLITHLEQLPLQLSREAGAAQRAILEAHADTEQRFVMTDRRLASLACTPAQALEIGEQFNRSLHFIGQCSLHRSSLANQYPFANRPGEM
jgi:hypothetical protein